MKKIIITVIIIMLVPIIALGATQYKVVSGDSLWKIAVKYQVGVSDIININKIPNPALIYPGQIINIPPPPTFLEFENQVVVLVNQQRAKSGLQALKSNWQLARCARLKSEDMAKLNYFSHTSPTYGSPFKMMENFGLRYSAAAENIAQGQRTPQEVMNAWMNSPGHRANILSQSVTNIGVGVAKNKSGSLLWTQQFIKPL